MVKVSVGGVGHVVLVRKSIKRIVFATLFFWLQRLVWTCTNSLWYEIGFFLYKI